MSLKKIKLSFPDPFQIAISLSLVTFLLTILITRPVEVSTIDYSYQVLKYWQKGFWELLEFTMQMVLILVLGHALALSPVIDRTLTIIAKRIHSNTSAILIVGLSALIAGLLNWGLGLIFGAIFTRKIGEQAVRNNFKLNYPLLGAVAYTCMLVWHGGFSGSAPLTVAAPDHFLASEIGVISIDKTLLSPLNITATLLILSILPISMWILSKRKISYEDEPTHYLGSVNIKEETSPSKAFGGVILGTIMLSLALSDLFVQGGGLATINLNYVNFILFAVGLILHRSFKDYIQAVQEAISGATGIIIQFPIYAGIMGIMKYSGLLAMIAGFFIAHSTAESFPILTFFSAALINVFVPSGGGQWAIQGPIVIDAAKQLGVNYERVIMALSYGDQVTNMLQPFWALPLLALTKIPAKKLLTYTIPLMIVGILIFVLVLWLA